MTAWAGKKGASPYELFYDLVFVGAILGLSLSFGQTTSFENVLVAAATFLFAWWVWQETMLFSNRFGDPLAPLPVGGTPREARIAFATRVACLIQMTAIVILALDQPDGLDPEQIDSGFAWASVVAALTVFVLWELGSRLDPGPAGEVWRRRVWSLVAVGLLVAAAVSPGVFDELLWGVGLIVLVAGGSVLRSREQPSIPPAQLSHISERLMLFVLIVSGDLFLKIIVYWNASLTETFELIQLVFVSVIVFSFFRIYTSAVVSRPVPDRPAGLKVWLGLHYLLSFALLMAAGGMVEYVTPKEGVDSWILLTAGIGLAVSVLAIAALTAYAGSGLDRKRAIGLCVVSAVMVAATVAVAFLTPGDWRIGVGTLAVIMVATAIWTSVIERSEGISAEDA